MALKKPPLVEVWLSFRFEPAAGSPEWDWKRYEVFLEALADTHPNVEEIAHRAVQLAASKSGKHPRVKQILEKILAVRAISEDGLRVVQMTPDLLTVNYVRGDSEQYPGFSTLLDEAMGYCRKYTGCYRPAGVVEAAVHYVDAVEVPVPNDRALKSEEYFTIQFETPVETFGGLVALEIKAMMLPPNSKELVELIFTSYPPAGNGAAYRRFNLEWHTAARTGSRMEEDSLRVNLQAAHDRLQKCFRGAFTSKGWALFEPDDQS